jgi:polyhydroxyalkanoate depolymerase
MIYSAYQAQADFLAPVRAMAKLASAAIAPRINGVAHHAGLRSFTATCELIALAGLTHERPDYGISSVMVGNREAKVTEEASHVLPFGTLLHFKKDIEAGQPKVLLVAPMSGHFATLLRGTVATLLADHDVYITDWHNARDVALKHGPFGFDDFIDYLIEFLEVMGEGSHVVAVCQPCVAVLAAVAIMAEDANPALPRSMTLMAGPIDTRVSPTVVNKLATGHSFEWFERNLIATVPLHHVGGLRRVYPGFLQIAGFMSMNIDRHIKAHADLYEHLQNGEIEKAEAIRSFYDEYFAVMDLPAEFYLETVRTVFQEFALPLGKLTTHGRAVDPRAIKRVMLFTVEGEKDDICAVGQTMAAHDLCTSLRPYMKRHHMQAGVGHYGVFNGRRWTAEIYPMLRNVIYSSN